MQVLSTRNIPMPPDGQHSLFGKGSTGAENDVVVEVARVDRA